MAGRPRKDPSGAPLVSCNLNVPGRVKDAAKAAAAAHGVPMVDYVCALIAQDNPEVLAWVPALQEVLPKSA